jgi:predicted amidohydrolase
MKIHLSRWVCLDVESNLQRLVEESGHAVANGADLVVLPELFLTGYSRSVDPVRARSVFAEVSAEAGETLFVFGSISEEGHNRVTAWSGGRQIATYDKVHLFRPNGEFEMWRPGDRYTAFDWRGLRVGLMNCNDIRFPEQGRALRLRAGADLFVVPAWWPWRRDHIWSTLLQARAVENSVWVFGCCIAGSVSESEDFAGAGNHVFDPSGEPVRTTDDRSYEIDTANPPVPVIDPVGDVVTIDRVEVVKSEEVNR